MHTTHGLVMGVCVGAVLTLVAAGGGIDSLQRVGITSVSRFVAIASSVEPHSCWCEEPLASCPVLVPTAPLHQLLNLSCGADHVLCCMERLTDLDADNVLPFNASGSITTTEEFKDFLHSIAAILKPYSQETTAEDAQQYLRSLLLEDTKEARVERSTYSQGAEYGPESDRHVSALWQSRASEDDLSSLYLSHDLETNSLFGGGPSVEPEGPLSSVPVQGDPLFNIIKSLASVLLTSENGALFAASASGNDTSSSTSSISDKVDLVQYAKLGWFSKAVEFAVDGSIYVGVAIAVMYFVSVILSGLISTVGSTCLVCVLLGNPEIAALG